MNVSQKLYSGEEITKEAILSDKTKLEWNNTNAFLLCTRKIQLLGIHEEKAEERNKKG